MSRYELTKQKYLSENEQNQLIGTLNRFKDTDFRNTTLIWIALHTGGRASEILNIRPEDLNADDRSVFLRGLKDSDNRDIPLPDWLFARIQVLAEKGRPFPISYPRFKQIWDQYRPVKKKLHALRHTFAINLYRKSKDILLLKMALGHKSLNNTMIYAHFEYKNTELRKAILG